MTSLLLTRILPALAALVLLAALLLLGARLGHGARLAAVEQALLRKGVGGSGAVFRRAMVESLPAPAVRWLTRAIAPETPLATRIQLTMVGDLRTGRGADPMPFRARQVLAPGRGFVWRARAGTPPAVIRGWDAWSGGEGELRWWLLGLVPVVTGTGQDVSRSAAGRLAGESILVPSAFVPGGPGVAGDAVRWEAVDDTTARVTVPGPEPTPLTLTIDGEGRLLRVRFPRWNGDAANGPVGWLVFGVDFEGEIGSGGYTVPREMRAGWRPDEPDGFVFFRARLESVAYR